MSERLEAWTCREDPDAMMRAATDRLAPDGSRHADESDAARGAVAARAPIERQGVNARFADLGQLDCHYDPADAALWTFMRPEGRASFNAGLLEDFAEWQRAIDAGFAGAGAAFDAACEMGGAMRGAMGGAMCGEARPADPRPPLDWLVLGSRVPGVFCYGGDLALFARLIRAGDRAGLIAYGEACVTILHRNWRALGRRLVTVGLVQGDALGGGWEALLSFDVVIAERTARFALPEVSFGLFPGMGAHAMLSRKLGAATAQRLISSGATFDAETLHAMGLVQLLAEPGEGIAAARAFIRRETRRHAGLVGAQAAMRLANPLPLAELVAIVTLWADTALRLTEQDLRLMERIVGAQSRRAGGAGSAGSAAAPVDAPVRSPMLRQAEARAAASGSVAA